MQQFGTVCVYVSVVDSQVPQTPAGQLLRIVPLRRSKYTSISNTTNNNNNLRTVQTNADLDIWPFDL